jgi:ubiquinone/menaquinone biosynthesis C-methylase UbiE
VGLYTTQIVPRLLDVAGGASATRPWRRHACEGLSGAVVEIGFGSGHNVAFYPPEVTALFAVEPSDVAWRLSAARRARSRVAITRVGRVGEVIPLEARTCDAALITFTLCTVDDPARVLAEVTRVLRPGASVHVVEHGRASEGRVARWQRRLDPVQRRLFDGCHLTRDPREMLRDAGLEITWSESAFARGPQPWTYLTAAVARTPS